MPRTNKDETTDAGHVEVVAIEVIDDVETDHAIATSVNAIQKIVSFTKLHTNKVHMQKGIDASTHNLEVHLENQGTQLENVDNTDVLIIIETTATKLKLMAMRKEVININPHKEIHQDLIVKWKEIEAGLHTDLQEMNPIESIALEKNITTLTVVLEKHIVIVEAGVEAILLEMNVREIGTKEINRLINPGEI